MPNPGSGSAGKVVVMGGGVAGMSAAHELIERGFEVLVLEANTIAGGKARSVAATVDGLPGEHGFRFFPGFYRHITDTQSRIPFPGNFRGVLDNLVDTTGAAAARYARDLIPMNAGFPATPEQLLKSLQGLFGNPFDLTEAESRFFVDRVMQIATSCDERRIAEYESQDWWTFIDAPNFSANYQKVFASTTRSLVAADPRRASAKTIGDITLQAVLGTVTPGKVYDRVLDGPTSVEWIDPWLSYLRLQGVDYRTSCRVEEIQCDAQRVTGVKYESGGVSQIATGDWFVAALPVEKMALLVGTPLLALDPGLARIPTLAASHVSWMSGIQFYLREKVPVAHGHVLYVDAPWALTSISQAQFWPDIDFASFGDGSIRDCLSVDISDWGTEGLNDKKAKDCTLDEIKTEVWRQLRASLNGGGVIRLRDDLLHSAFLDPGIEFHPGNGPVKTSHEPLLVNDAGTWALRPQAVTRAPNLFLASDYVQTFTDLACMEGANEAARRAVNGLLVAAGSDRNPCRVWPLPIPEMLQPFRALDRERFERGESWQRSPLF
ncbi:MAG: hydroxysqualene dehydroxylase [Panacagrimonas sp.]